MTLLVFHLEISGKYFNDLQSLNTHFILITLLVSRLDMSGKLSICEHLLNK